jgi:hypothetical protein
MMALLKEALKDDSISHFAFLSEGCVPVKSWCEIRKRLTIDSRSMIDEVGREGMKPMHAERIAKVRDLPARCQRLHSQWCLLARDAAECVTAFDFTDHFRTIFAADEHYIGSVLALRGFDEHGRVHRTRQTWVRWGQSDGLSRPDTVSHVDAVLAGELAAFSGFFARKFAPDSDVEKWGLHQANMIRMSAS